MLQDLLAKLDLSEDEIKTYVAVLEFNQTTVGNLAKKLGMPRSSLYGFLKKLRAGGLITQSVKSGIQTFSAEPPEKIDLLFQQKVEMLQGMRRAYQELLPELQKHRPSRFLTPKFQLYEGEEGVKHLLKDILLYRNIETQTFWPIRTMVDILSPEFLWYHNKERIRQNIYIRAIWPQAHKGMINIRQHPYLGVGEAFKREIRIAPEGINFSMGYWIYGNKAAFISSRKESFGFIIESAELTEMLLAQFEVMWGMSQPLVTTPEETEAFLQDLKNELPSRI